MMDDSSTNRFDGLRVAVFEARMAGSLANFVTRHGGDPVAAPAMREIPLEDSPEAAAFVEGLSAGRFQMTIFETGVGVRYLVNRFDARLSKSDWAELLRSTIVVARGPKPATALRELGVKVDLLVPSPNTWRETLATLDDRQPVVGWNVAVQEYGKPNPELVDGLVQRGAVVTRVPIYQWALPVDLEPLRSTLRRIISGEIGVALFTSAQQVEHVLEVARTEGTEAELRAAFSTNVVIGSIGPTTTEALLAHDLPVDVVPEHPKSGQLVAAAAAGWRSVGKASFPSK